MHLPVILTHTHQFESGALLLYIADKYPAKSGIHTPKQRAAAAQWVLFANSTLANVSASSCRG